MPSKTLKYFIAGLSLIALTGFVAFEYACRQTETCKCSAFSLDKETAIKEGFYIDTYQPSKQVIVIPNTKDTIRFGSAWTEHSWQMERRLGLCLLEHKIKGEYYNFCMPFLTAISDINSYPFELKQLQKTDDPYYDGGSYLSNRFNFGINMLRDTIKVIIQQKQNDTTTANHFVDTVTYIRATNDR